MNSIAHAVVAVLLVAAANANAADQQPAGFLIPSYLPANRLISMTLCDADASAIQYPHYFHFSFLPTSISHSYTPAAVPGNGVVDGDTVSLPVGTPCQATTLTTLGLTSTSNASVYTGTCYDYRSTGGQRTCNVIGMYTFITPITPTVTISPSTILQIGFTGTPTVRAETVTLNPNIATLTINRACTVQNGAVVSAAPTSTGSDITDDSGKAFFNITASIGTPIPGLAPSGTCTFSVPLATNGANVAVQIQAPVYQPTIAIASPAMPINHPGPTLITTQVTPAYAGVQVDATCTVSQGATLALDAANRNTDALGRAAFTVTAQNLAIVNPNLNVVPTASCTFKVHGGTGTVNATFNTGNACAFGLQPAPAGCGNP